MDSTRISLLERIKDTEDSRAWGEFYGLYYRLLRNYGLRRKLSDADAEEIASQCMTSIVKQLNKFQYDRQRGRFRALLHRMVRDRISDYHRRKRPVVIDATVMTATPDDADSPDLVWEQTWLKSHLEHCLSVISMEFSAAQFECFSLYALEGWSPERVAKHLDISPNKVYLSKSRVMKRLKEEMSQFDVD